VPVSIELSQVIRTAPERVFEYRRNVETLPEYNPAVFGLRRAGEAYLFRVRMLGGFSVPVALTIVEATPPTRLVFDMMSLIDAQEICTFEPVAEGTRLRFEMRIATPPGALGWLVGRAFAVPNARRQVAAELEAMKVRLER
jgi:Polyketide cyclase / dehydrase and lipid transport